MQSGEVIRLRYKKTMEKEREGRETDTGFYRLFMIIFDYIVVHGVWAERRGGGDQKANENSESCALFAHASQGRNGFYQAIYKSH